MGAVWRLSKLPRRLRPAATLTAPLAMAAVIATWAVLVVVGWALIYWPHLPGGFLYSPGLDPDANAGLADALYLSLVAVTTLGLGDIVPAGGWLRLAVPLQSLVGFGLLTAAVSWVLQVYPALSRRRVLAIEMALLRGAEQSAGPTSVVSPSLLEHLAAGLVQVRVDLTQYAETYYFKEGDSSASLSASLAYAGELAARTQASGRAELQLPATLLADAVDDLVRVVGEQFLHVDGSRADVMAAFAADHGHEQV